VLFVNVPITALAAALAPRLLVESRSAGAKTFDVAGAFTITAGLSLLVYTLVDANDAGWTSAQTLGLGALAVGLIASFVTIELRSPEPLVPFGIFQNRTLTGANVAGVLTAASLFSMFFFISLYMQQVLGYDAMKAGLSYLPLAFGIIFAAGAASQLTTRFGFKPVFVAGLLLVAAGLLWFSRVSPGGTFAGDVLFPSLLAAVGLGFAFVSMTIGSVAGVSGQEAGLASGLINTSQQVGGALGLAILAAVATHTTGDAVRDPVALTAGFSDAFLVGAGFAVLGAVLALVLLRSEDVPAGEPLPVPA
jgi:predicted MFS family arabinose efflux permease